MDLITIFSNRPIFRFDQVGFSSRFSRVVLMIVNAIQANILGPTDLFLNLQIFVRA